MSDIAVRNKNVVVNIASDGLEEEIIGTVDSDVSVYHKRIKRYISEFLHDTVCGRIFFNVCYKRSVVHSDVVDTVLYNVERDEAGNVKKTEVATSEVSPLNKGYREMLRRNIDIIQMALEECRNYGVEVWLSVRMNDHHFPNDRSFNSTMGYDKADSLGVNGSRTYLDFTKKEVQSYYKAYIKELCERYVINGIELDFLRSCPIMSESTPENIKNINSFVGELREITKGANPNIQMAARVYPTVKKNMGFGIDAAQWIADGYIDLLTVENWYIPTYYNIPVEEWREIINSRNTMKNPYTLLCGTDWAVSCDESPKHKKNMWISLEQLKGFASGAYSRGADGIYLFNHFNTDDECHRDNNMGLFTCYIDEKGNKVSERVLKKKINSANSLEDAESGMRTYVNTYDENNPYPIEIANQKFFEFVLNTGSKPQKYYHILVGTDEDADVFVDVNETKTKRIENIKAQKGLNFDENSAGFEFIEHISETAACVMQFEADLSSVTSGFNSFKIASGKEKLCKVRWIEIQAE